MKELKLTQEESKLLYTELENYTPRKETYKEFMDLVRKLRYHAEGRTISNKKRIRSSRSSTNKRGTESSPDS